MSYKRILFTSPGIAALCDYEPQPLKSGQAMVRLARSAISSGTERANLVGDPNISYARPGRVKFPRSAGYSSSGVIVEVAPDVTDLQVGDRVALSWSSHSQLCAMDQHNLIKIGDTPFEEAALWHIATFPIAAIRKCRLELGESAIVMGQGVLGMMAVQLLRAAGAAPIIAVDPVPAKREHALRIGADYALDPFAEDFVQTVKDLTGGGAKVAIEVTGNGKALDQVLDCMARFGRVALLGCTRNSDFTIDYYRKVHGPGITMIGAHTDARPKQESYPGYWTTRDDMLAIQRLYKLGRLSFAQLLEEVHSPEECPEVFARLAAEKFFPLVQFNWEVLK